MKWLKKLCEGIKAAGRRPAINTGPDYSRRWIPPVVESVVLVRDIKPGDSIIVILQDASPMICDMQSFEDSKNKMREEMKLPESVGLVIIHGRTDIQHIRVCAE